MRRPGRTSQRRELGEGLEVARGQVDLPGRQRLDLGWRARKARVVEVGRALPVAGRDLMVNDRSWVDRSATLPSEGRW